MPVFFVLTVTDEFTPDRSIDGLIIFVFVGFGSVCF